MRNNVADTSIKAYQDLTPRQMSSSQVRLMRAIKEGCDYSRAELAQTTGMPLQSVCGRINELVTAGRLEHGPQRHCCQTGNTVNPVRLPIRQPELF